MLIWANTQSYPNDSSRINSPYLLRIYRCCSLTWFLWGLYRNLWICQGNPFAVPTCLLQMETSSLKQTIPLTMSSDYIVFLEFHVVTEWGHSFKHLVYNVLHNEVTVLSQFVFSHGMVQYATLVLCSTLNIRLQKWFYYYISFCSFPNYQHYVLRIFDFKLLSLQWRGSVSWSIDYFLWIFEFPQIASSECLDLFIPFKFYHWYFQLLGMSKPFIQLLLYCYISLTEHLIV